MRFNRLRPIMPGEVAFWLISGLLFLTNSLIAVAQTTPWLAPLRTVWPLLLLTLNLLFAVIVWRNVFLSMRQGLPGGAMLPIRRMPFPVYMLGLAMLGLGTVLGIYWGWAPMRATALGLSLAMGSMLVALIAIWRYFPLRLLGIPLAGGLSAVLLGQILPDWNIASRSLFGVGIYSLVLGVVEAWAFRSLPRDG